MKKFIATTQVRNLAMSLFFLLGLMVFGTGSASAQATIGGSSNWVPDGQAIGILKVQVQSLKGGPLQNADPAIYGPAEAKYHFWVGIVESIEGGMGTEAAYNANIVNITSQPALNAVGSSAANPNAPIDTKDILTSTEQLLTY